MLGNARDAGLDLALGSVCVGCSSPGRVLCRSCDNALPRHGHPAWPTPTPTGLAVPYTAGAYDGVLKAMVNAHKEHQVLALAGPLGRMLSDVVSDLVSAVGTRPVDGPDGRLSQLVLLVPVPSRRAVVRRRGHDPLLRVTRTAAARLRRQGIRATCAQLLVPRGRVRDQSTLDASARLLNLSGSMRARSGAAAGVVPGALVIVVDDVLTTGATAREAQRALEDAGVRVTGIAAVAATRRWHAAGVGSLGS